MLRFLTGILTLLLSVLTMSAVGRWVMHPSMGDEVTRVCVTPRYVYFACRAIPYDKNSQYNSEEILSLFRYDKEGDELVALSTDNLLSFPTVRMVEYSLIEKMLVAVGSDGSITLLGDDGTMKTVFGFASASSMRGNEVNGITIDADNHRAYLSTGSGYLTIDLRKGNIADSRDFGTPLTNVARIADRMLVASGGKLYIGKQGASPRSLADMQPVSGLTDVTRILPLSESSCLAEESKGDKKYLRMIDVASMSGDMPTVTQGSFTGYEPVKDGILAATAESIVHIGKDGDVNKIPLPEGDFNSAVGSYDMKEVWLGRKVSGFASRKLSGSADACSWSVTRDWFLPDAPAPFRTGSMVMHSDMGLIVANHGYDTSFEWKEDGGPLLLSAYKDGQWSYVSPLFTNPDVPETLHNPNGLALDPDNPDYAYVGSVKSGMKRVNMSDGGDVIHFSSPGDSGSSLPGFVKLVEDQTGNPSPIPGIGNTWKGSCVFTPPAFDAKGNLWTTHPDYDDQKELKLHLFCWEAADRKSSTSASDIKLPKKLEVKGIQVNNREMVLPLKAKVNDGILAYARRHWDEALVFIDTNGTPLESADDNVVSITTFTDTDGKVIDVHNISTLWEDPSSGRLWVCHPEGIFYVTPAEYLKGNGVAHRIKVARGDGTGLADYLLNNVKVNAIAVDGAGRKWFATAGGGIIGTSSDGKEIHTTLTASNSQLPSDVVYGLAYIPESNSMMVSTERGMCEYFMPASASESDSKSKLKIYPNPVRPEYGGYVTIEGLREGMLVKITDASGSLVRELGVSSGDSMQWDVTDHASRRVGSGVYYVLCSDSNAGSGFVVSGKLLVVN